ncbi:sensor histidine kinase [Phytohabitans suffuscus]|uniref:histidine kinase n=1 Tax=Phytohabitans suffuscus TaxID=624315 RepID=A0A6F8YQA9_9ACTN|nr:HAMP domain-containing sensor histidine kinase [Phytohabitans suffuscus]BCB88264.1 two-component sensor histidine kinase [Phytohabitans suffuscus]
MRSRSGWLPATRSIHTRILLSYIGLIVLASGLATIAIREVLMIRLERRVQQSVQQEFLEMDLLVTQGSDPRTGTAFTSVERAFDVYFQRNVPSNEEAMLAFSDGRLYRSSMTRFPLERLPQPVMERLATSAPTRAGGSLERFDTARGEAYYRTMPVTIGNDRGAFVVTFLPIDERAEIGDLLTYSVAGILGVLVLASACAWLMTSRVLGPVRQLTDTARLISQSDLTRRIPVTGRDEAAEMARTFNAMLDRLEAVFRREREFIVDASHELRGPLTISLGNLGLLEHTLDDERERRRTIAIVSDELERMGRIVGDLHLLADVAHPQFLQPERIDLELFVVELAAKLGALAPRPWHLDGAPQGTIVADRHRLTEAVINLADNAVHNTEPTDTVALGAALDGRCLRLWVRDTGRGIPLDEQSRVFDRFRRGAGAQARYRGTGLGLSIVRAIAQAHGGRVELASRPGAGATFTLVIPEQLRKGWPVGQDLDR